MQSYIRRSVFLLVALLLPATAFAEDFKIHRYVANTFNVNSYLLESESGVVLIDAQLLRSDAKKIAMLIKYTDKPLMGVFITHPHADHFGGLNALVEEFGEFPIYATQVTADSLPEAHAEAVSWARDAYGDDFDSTFVPPNTILEDDMELTIAGIPLVVDDIGPGESANSLLIHAPEKNILFTGDATLHGSHFYVGEGHSANALEQHHYMAEKYGDVSLLYTGHGDPRKPSAVFKWEIDYISYTKDLVEQALASKESVKPDGSGFTEAVRTELIETVLARYGYLGSYGFADETMVGWNVDGLFRELSAAE